MQINVLHTHTHTHPHTTVCFSLKPSAAFTPLNINITQWAIFIEYLIQNQICIFKIPLGFIFAVWNSNRMGMTQPIGGGVETAQSRSGKLGRTASCVLSAALFSLLSSSERSAALALPLCVAHRVQRRSLERAPHTPCMCPVDVLRISPGTGAPESAWLHVDSKL